MVCEDECEGLKNCWIGQSAAEPTAKAEEGSTTRQSILMIIESMEKCPRAPGLENKLKMQRYIKQDYL
jgi:hypothetical protein